MFQAVRIRRNFRVIAALVAVGFVVLQVLSHGSSEDYRPSDKTREALSLSRKGQKEAAYQLYLDQAREGDRFAQFAVGSMLARGDLGRRNLEKAVQWLKRAAKNGQPAAQYSLGRIYLNQPMYGNRSAAIDWFQRAASKGYPGASNQLGLIYESGSDVKKDTERAMGFFRDAARLGSIHGVINAARLLAEAKAEWATPVERFKWLLILDNLSETPKADKERNELKKAMYWTNEAHGWIAAHWWLFRYADQFDK